MIEGIEVRRAEVGDVAAVLRVQGACLEAPQWWESVWRDVLGENEVGLRCVMVAEADGGVVGYVVTGGVAGVAELESVAVAVASRGQGVGRALCEAAMRWVAGRGAVAVELEVRVSSAGARRLYARLGFVEQGGRKEYYKGPVEDAVLMGYRVV